MGERERGNGYTYLQGKFGENPDRRVTCYMTDDELAKKASSTQYVIKDVEPQEDEGWFLVSYKKRYDNIFCNK